MVSHRAEMQESASRLIGLYLCDEMPRAISLGFNEADKIFTCSDKIGSNITEEHK